MKLPNFDTTITVIRKYWVSISIILQSIQQLEMKYWKWADIILNGGIASKIFFNGADPSTAKMLSEILWTITTKDDDTNYKKTENLMNAFNIRTLEDNQALYLYSNKLPILLEMIPYYLKSNS
jgi:type IV secretory pathway TraG/TraD family ATPase VirD4